MSANTTMTGTSAPGTKRKSASSPPAPRSSSAFTVFFFSSRRRHTIFDCDWSSDVCSSDLVADLLGGAPAGPGPLIGAEFVQRGALGRGAGVAAHQVQGVNGHIDAVAVLILEHQELPGLAEDVHRHQARVAADSVLLVHHRRARVEVLEVAQDRLRIRGALAPSLLAGACPEQLRFP